MAKKTKPRKQKKYNRRSSTDRSLNKSIPGFFMRWSSEDPLGDHDKAKTVQVGHTNPVMNLRLRNQAFWDSMRMVLHTRRLRWRMEIQMDFKKPDKIETKAMVIQGVGPLPELDESYQETVESMLQDAVQKNYIDCYQITRVLQEVLPGEIIKEEDFKACPL